MNRIYRLVWSRTHSQWVVADERSRAQGKSGGGRKGALANATLGTLALVSGLALADAPPAADALPQGGVVVAGSAQIGNPAANQMQVLQSSDQAVINWNSFDIGSQAQVEFVQPSAQSAVLNRVITSDVSQIAGQMTANGKVYIVNPNGIVFANGSQVNTAALVASTLDIADDDFMAGRMKFERGNATGEIRNEGSLNAESGGYVALLGARVINNGDIHATGGRVVLAAGDRIQLPLTASGNIRLAVDAATVNAAVTNSASGIITATDGQVYLSAAAASGLAAQVVNEGQITARDGGSITASAIQADGLGETLNKGSLDVGSDSGKGGTVTLLGDRIGLLADSKIQADGATGGGEVLVGGDERGQGSSHKADAVYVSSDAAIDASATVSGDGGKVVLWSQSYTGFYGEIAARGGSLGGDGGRVETSSFTNLQAFGNVDAAAPIGDAGQWLLDPTDVTIVAGAVNSNETELGGIWTPTTNTAQIGVNNINTQLNAGTNVVIETASAGAGVGNITQNAGANISKTAGANTTLTMNATGSITLNGNTSATVGSLATTLNAAGGAVSGTGTINTNGGLLTVNAASGTGTLSGAISGSGGLTKSGGGITTLSGANTFTGATTVSGGTLILTGAGSTGHNSATTVDTGATLELAGAANVDHLAGFSLTLNTGSTLNKTNTGYNGFNSSNITPSGTVAINITNNGVNNQLFIGGVGTGLRGSGTINLTNTGSATTGVTFRTGNSTPQFSGTMNVIGGVVNVGNGASVALRNTELNLTNSARLNISTTFGTTASNATLRALNGDSTSTVNISTGGLNLIVGNGNGSGSFAGVIFGTGRLNKNGTGTQILTGNNTYNITTTVNAGTLQIGDGGTSGSLGASVVTNNANLVFNRSDVYTVSNAISGTGALTQAGTGTTILSGINTYTGVTNVNVGTLQAGSSSAFGSNSAVTLANVASATLDLNGFNNSIGSLAGGGTIGGNVNLGTATLTIGGNNTSTTYGGVVDGTGGLVKTGTGTATLVDNHTYTGTTTISAGTLRIGNGGTTGTLGSGAVTDNANLVFNRSDSTNLATLAAGGITGTGNLSALIGGSLDVDRTITLTGAGSTLLIEAGKDVATGNVTGGDVTLTSNISTTAGGSVTIFSGSANTAALEANISGATGATRYKTYNASVADVSGAVAGTRNYYYRQAATATVNGLTASKVYDGTVAATSALDSSGASVSGTLDGDTLSFGALTLGSATFDSQHAGPRILNASFTGTPTSAIGGATWSVSNYSATGTGSATITPAALTLMASTNSKTYDATTTAVAVPTVNGLQGADTVSGLSESYADKNVGTGKTLNVDSGYTINDGNGGGNYAVNVINNTTGVITPANLTLTAAADSKVYDGTINSIAAPSSIGLFGTDSVTGLSQSFADRHAGTGKTLLVNAGYIVNDGNGGNNYSVTSANSVTGTITPAALTMTAVSDSKVYDGSAGSIGAPLVAGLIGTDIVTGRAQAFTNKDAGTGKTLQVSSYTLLDGNGGNNYAVNLVNDNSGVITAADLIVHANNDARFVTQSDSAGYGGVSFTGFVNGETAAVLGGSVNISRTNSSMLGAGLYVDVLQASGLTSSNYNLIYDLGDYHIVPANELLVKLGNTASTYGSNANYSVVSAEYLLPDGTRVALPTSVNGDKVAVNDAAGGVTFQITLSNPLTSSSGHLRTGSYQLGGGSVTGSSANFSNNLVVVGSQTVDPRVIGAALAGASKVYDGTISITGLNLNLPDVLEGDLLTARGSGSFESKHVGSGIGYAVSNLILNGVDRANYVLGGSGTYTGNDGIITPATLTLAAVGDSKIYDATTNSAGAPTTSGLFGTDSVTGLAQSFADRNAGTGKVLMINNSYVINDGNGGNNYMVNLLDATGTITPAALTLIATANTKVYDATTDATATPLVDGLLGTDSVSGLREAYTNKNAGTGKAIAVTDYTVNDGNGGRNYVVSLVGNAEGVITPRPITVAAPDNVSKYHDGTINVPTGYSPIIVSGGLGETLESGDLAYATPDVGEGKTVNLSNVVVDDGNNGQNYIVTTVPSQLGIIWAQPTPEVRSFGVGDPIDVPVVEVPCTDECAIQLSDIRAQLPGVCSVSAVDGASLPDGVDYDPATGQLNIAAHTALPATITLQLSDCYGRSSAVRIELAAQMEPVQNTPASAYSAKAGEEKGKSNWAIYFAHNSSAVVGQYQELLQEIAARLTANTSLSAKIQGYTDSSGTLAYNLKLALERATAIKEMIMELYGVEEKRLETYGFGPMSSLATTGTSDPAQRKAEVNLIKPIRVAD